MIGNQIKKWMPYRAQSNAHVKESTQIVYHFKDEILTLTTASYEINCSQHHITISRVDLRVRAADLKTLVEIESYDIL